MKSKKVKNIDSNINSIKYKTFIFILHFYFTFLFYIFILHFYFTLLFYIFILHFYFTFLFIS